MSRGLAILHFKCNGVDVGGAYYEQGLFSLSERIPVFPGPGLFQRSVAGWLAVLVTDHGALKH